MLIARIYKLIFNCTRPHSASMRVRVTYPFHPLVGREFVWVAERSSGHGERVWCEQTDGSVITLPRAWTDRAMPDPFAALSGGRCHFRPEDLAELVEVIAGIQGGEQGSDRADHV